MLTKSKTEYYFSWKEKDKALQENLEYASLKIEVNEERKKEQLMRISFFQERWMTKQDHILLYKKLIEILEEFNP